MLLFPERVLCQLVHLTAPMVAVLIMRSVLPRVIGCAVTDLYTGQSDFKAWLFFFSPKRKGKGICGFGSRGREEKNWGLSFQVLKSTSRTEVTHPASEAPQA